MYKISFCFLVRSPYVIKFRLWTPVTEPILNDKKENYTLFVIVLLIIKLL